MFVCVRVYVCERVVSLVKDGSWTNENSIDSCDLFEIESNNEPKQTFERSNWQI